MCGSGFGKDEVIQAQPYPPRSGSESEKEVLGALVPTHQKFFFEGILIHKFIIRVLVFVWYAPQVKRFLESKSFWMHQACIYWKC